MLSAILAAMMFAAQAAAPPPLVVPAPAQALDPAALAAARDLLHAIGFEEQLEATALRVAEDTFATMTREFETRYGEPIPADLRGRVHAIMVDNIAQVVAELRPTALDDAARVYARYFTAGSCSGCRPIR